MKCEYLLCARGAATDQLTGSISALDIIEEYLPPAYPAFMPALRIIVLFSRNLEEECNQSIDLIISAGSIQIFKETLPVRFERKLRNRATVGFAGLPLAGPGELVFQVCLPNGTQIGRYCVALETPAAGELFEAGSAS